MPEAEETMDDSKAQKLAAARKKLKEYQQRGATSASATPAPIAPVGDGDVAALTTTGTSAASVYVLDQIQQRQPSLTGSASSNVSERSDSELNLNGVGGSGGPDNVVYNAVTVTPMESVSAERASAATVAIDVAGASMATAAGGGDMCPVPMFYESGSTSLSPETVHTAPPSDEAQPTQQSLQAIQVLIAEKAQITTELSKYRNQCREKELELEEMRVQFASNAQRLAELQQRFVAQQQSTEQLRHTNAELQHKLAQASASDEDRVAHIDELQKQLMVAQTQASEVTQQLKEKCSELEMAQLRIRQLSDEAHIGKDNRVETLTQTQFMYEQQIRDLQAMVQQLTQDKEQANVQYQNYVEHLKSEAAQLTEKNSELTDECAKLQERERQLIDHVGGLEREIQKNISRQDQYKEAQKTETSNNITELTEQLAKLQEQINDFDFERHEFQLKIKSQEDRLDTLKAEVQQKQNELDELREQLANVTAEQPDKTKLLATMESDKVAASRALTQNVALKQQLDELELRFVQLTNDKADLVNRLDAEEYANREMRTNYAAMEDSMRTSEERFKFKDDEMIRLSHENMELMRKNLVLQQQVDRLHHYDVVKQYNTQYAGDDGDNAHHIHEDHDEHIHLQEDDAHTHDDGCKHSHEGGHADESDTCEEAKEEQQYTANVDTAAIQVHQESQHQHQQQHSKVHDITNIPTVEAVERLQTRFTRLMSQVADLTEEKQRLEHLVLQLQSETETIGEYIALYQTQRRILKQREYEKAAQMQLLQSEREQMREKITLLTQLVGTLGLEASNTINGNKEVESADAEQLSATSTQNEALLAEMTPPAKSNATDSQQILTKIQSIISEIREDTTKEVPTVPMHTVDHFNCCLGKFEIV